MPKIIISTPMTRITGPIIFKCPPHSCLERNLSRSSPNSLGRYEIAVKTQPIRINMNAIMMRIMLQLAEINRPPIVIPTPAPSSLDSILKEEDFCLALTNTQGCPRLPQGCPEVAPSTNNFVPGYLGIMVTRHVQFCCIFAVTKDKFDYF